MPRSTKQFWQAAEDWSRRKHLILSYYLTPAAPKLRTQSANGRVHVLDGFAGRGKYADGSPGSPIYMGQLAVECRRWSNPVALIIHNIEPDPDSFKDLEGCTRQWADARYIINRRGTFQQYLPTVLQDVGTAPLFAFLDPFRPSHLSFQDILPLLKRTDTTEVCIVFHTPAVMRVLDAIRPTARTPEKTKRALAIRLDEVFGSRRWETLINVAATTPDNVISCLAEEIKSHVQWENLFVCWHDIKARYQSGLKYQIVFLTRHPDGVQLMNDAFCKEGQDVYEQVASSQTSILDLGLDEPNLPVVERTSEQRILALEKSLIEIGREKPDRVWKRSDLRFASMMKQFGDFTWAEHRKAIDVLLHRSAPPKLIAPEVKPKKTGRIVTNDNTLVRFTW